MEVWTKEGNSGQLTFQTSKVTKPLGSVKRMCEVGNQVVFDDGGSYIINKATGKKTWLEEKNGIYVMKVKIRPQPRKMNVSIWSGAPIPLAYARDVRLQDTPDEDCELEISSVSQIEQAKPHIMESFRIASTPDAGRA